MVKNFTLTKDQTALLVVDVQDKLFKLVDRPLEVLEIMQKVIKGFQILQLPIFATEQYPQGLGHTVIGLQSCLGDNQIYLSKTCFSSVSDPMIKQKMLESGRHQWVLMGIEAHVCILQTAKDLLAAGEQVVVLNDAITSRSIYDYSTAIAEMRDLGIRVSCAETVLFELLKDSKALEFKQISQLIK
jgi:nicotinamidase-related amidase